MYLLKSKKVINSLSANELIELLKTCYKIVIIIQYKTVNLAPFF